VERVELQSSLSIFHILLLERESELERRRTKYGACVVPITDSQSSELLLCVSYYQRRIAIQNDRSL
jgi:hypothetical protein